MSKLFTAEEVSFDYSKGKRFEPIRISIHFPPYRKHGVKITHPDGTVQKIFNSWYE